MTESRYTSWGRCIDAGQQILLQQWRHLPIAAADACGSILPFGNGRSYGDSCLNDGGTLLDARPLRRFITFDAEAGVLCCESGVLIDEIPEGIELRVGQTASVLVQTGGAGDAPPLPKALQ